MERCICKITADIKQVFLAMVSVVWLLCPPGKTAEGIRQPASCRICAGFMGLNDIELLPKMAQNGLNTALVVFGSLHYPMTPQQSGLIRQWAGQCERFGLQFIPVINLWGHDEKYWVTPHYHFFYDSKDFADTPCPTDEFVYEQVIQNRLVELAKLSLQIPIYGAVIDTEMYGAGLMGYPQQPCLCDHCFGGFQQSRHNSDSIPAKSRLEYLRKAGLTDSYYRFIAGQVAAMARRTAEQIEKINPAFSVGVLQLDRSCPHNDGLADGFGRGKMPVLAFSEQTYSIGFTEYVPQSIKRFRDLGLNVKFVVGLWQDVIPIANLSEQYYHSAKNSDGYWVYTMESLNESYWKGLLTAPRSEFWRAIRTANEELVRLCSDSSYKSPLKLRPFETPLQPIDFNSIRTEPLEYLRPGTAPDSLSQPPQLHSFNQLVFVAKKGEHIRFQIAFNKRPDAQTSRAEASLLTNAGRRLAVGTATAERNAVLESAAPYSGSYGIFLNADRNTLSVTGFTHPYSIFAGRWPQTHLIRPSSPLYLWQPAASKEAQITWLVDGPAEAVRATFKTESGETFTSLDILSKQTNTIPLPPADGGQIIVLNIEPLSGAYFEDVFITIDTGLGKYISPFKCGLVRPAVR